MDAIISDCGRYRYWLKRKVDGIYGGTIAWIMCNPSTADAEVDDATIRKVTGFSSRWGYRQLIVVNVYAYRATDVRRLSDVMDPVGPLNGSCILRAIDQADKVVCAWGRYKKMPTGGREAGERVRARGNMWALGVNADGSPVHPLMIGYDVPLVKY